MEGAPPGYNQPPAYNPGYSQQPAYNPGYNQPINPATVQVQVAQPTQPVTTNTGPYFHQQHGTFYWCYYLLAGVISCLFLVMIINMIRLGADGGA